MNRGGEDLVFETESNLLKNEGIEVINITFRNSSFKFFNFIFYPFNFVSFFRMVLALWKHKPDVVHIHNWHFAASPSIIVATKITGIPVIQTLHNHRLISHLDILNTEKGNPSEVFTKVNSRKFSVSEVFKVFTVIQSLWLNFCSATYKYSGIWKLIDKYIVLTESSKKLYSASHFKSVSDKFVVKSNFINGKEIKPKEKKDFLLYVGRLTREKGVHILLSAVEHTGIPVKIIGDGPLRKEVEQLVRSNKNIEYLGFRDFGYIKDVMAESKATIFPSMTLEGMPMTIIESFACGTPVITSKYSAMENMIIHGYNGFHFEIGNIIELRERLLQVLLLNNQEIFTLSENARKSYEDNYSPEKNITNLINIYTSVCRNQNLQIAPNA
jgi:glycosyltransferase involved in cell wall biosynthesis